MLVQEMFRDILEPCHGEDVGFMGDVLNRDGEERKKRRNDKGEERIAFWRATLKGANFNRSLLKRRHYPVRSIGQ
jgi:hypothetical protein